MQTPAPEQLFDRDHWQKIQPILKSLSQQQALWISGYLAGGLIEVELGQPIPGPSAPLIMVAFGTETDNSRHLAEQLVQLCTNVGIQAELADLSAVRPRKLTKVDILIVISATHGDGDPPEPVADFYEAIMADDAPSLTGLKFAVLALGDSSYEQFCATGVEFDQRLESLGGERLISRQDCDVDFEQPAAAWMSRLLEKLGQTEAGTASPAVAAASSMPTQASTEISKRNPLSVEVLTNQNLSHASRPAPIHHLELALEDENFSLEPGDAVGVLVNNPPELVACVLDATELSGEQAVLHAGEALPLVEVLREHCDLTIPGKAFLEMWASVSQSEQLEQIVQAENAVQRQFLRDHQVQDLLHAYPGRPAPQVLVDALRPLQPRLYDVANSLEAIDDELHLTVKAFSYPFQQRCESGIAAQFLLSLEPGDIVRLYPHRNTRFRLPDQDDLPIILIAEGTGIAPYRAFLQALAKRNQRTPCWLVFAEKSFENDFLYQLDVQQAHKEGVCSFVDTVFTSDKKCVSLSSAVVSCGDRLMSWLEQGAHIYFCGEKQSLEHCEAGIQAFVDVQAKAPAWKQLTKDKRIHRNLY